MEQSDWLISVNGAHVTNELVISQLKYVFRLEKNEQRVVGQNPLTP